MSPADKLALRETRRAQHRQEMYLRKQRREVRAARGAVRNEYRKAQAARRPDLVALWGKVLATLRVA
jgi:hypothetical protein